jgi:predicted transcriptional regulator
MPEILVHLDDATMKALDRIAPAANRNPADFIRQAVKDAIFRNETKGCGKHTGCSRIQRKALRSGTFLRNGIKGRHEAVRDPAG